MKTSELDYDLPEGQIAQRPTATRDGARMLVLEKGGFQDAHVEGWAELVPAGALVVVNDTKVLDARLFGQRKDTGGKVELLLLRRVIEPSSASGDARELWTALTKAGGTLAPGVSVVVGEHELEIVERRGRQGAVVRLPTCGALALLAAEGHVPLPPYVKRADDEQDRARYQTVFARVPGSAAAPTAGLHLTEAALGRLATRGVEVARVTLHVGAGTFFPVKTEHLDEHEMHTETYALDEELVVAVEAARRRGAPVVAVGTTVVRAVESAAALDGGLRAGVGETALFIRPGFEFRVVDALLTNFHAPRSTLLALVAAFAGYDRMRAAYQHAVDGGYRFLSYGDAMWIPERGRC